MEGDTDERVGRRGGKGFVKVTTDSGRGGENQS